MDLATKNKSDQKKNTRKGSQAISCKKSDSWNPSYPLLLVRKRKSWDNLVTKRLNLTRKTRLITRIPLWHSSSHTAQISPEKATIFPKIRKTLSQSANGPSVHPQTPRVFWMAARKNSREFTQLRTTDTSPKHWKWLMNQDWKWFRKPNKLLAQENSAAWQAIAIPWSQLLISIRPRWRRMHQRAVICFYLWMSKGTRWTQLLMLGLRRLTNQTKVTRKKTARPWTLSRRG